MEGAGIRATYRDNFEENSRGYGPRFSFLANDRKIPFPYIFYVEEARREQQTRAEVTR